MNADEPALVVTLPPQPQYLALARRVVAGFARHLGMNEAAVGDLKTVLTEACAMAVGPGSSERAVRVEAATSGDELTLTVRDRGDGLRQAKDQTDGRAGLGLKLISALSRHEFASAPGGGTAISMRLALTPAPAQA